MPNPPKISCWDCAFLNRAGDRFVDDFTCNNPEIIEKMKARGVQFLKSGKLDTGCPYGRPRRSGEGE